jgi:hypothetical protein
MKLGVGYSVAFLANTTYNWTVPVGSSIIGGQGTETITVNFGSIPGNVAVTPSTTSGCAGTPDSKAVVINLRPDLGVSDNAVCSKAISGITFVTAGVTPASTYNVTSVTFSIPGLTPLFGPTMGVGADNLIMNDSYENKTGGPIQVRYTVVPISIDNCSGAAEIVTLTVNPEPILSNSLSKSVCSKQPSGINLAVAVGSVAAPTYNITINANGLLPSAGAPANGNGLFASEIADDAWINTSAVPVDVEYTVRPVSAAPNSCIGDPTIVRLTVNPEPIVDPIGETICSGDMPGITLTATNLPGSLFTWTVKTVTGFITGMTNGSGPAITNTLINSGGCARQCHV